METHENDNNPLVSIIVITYNSSKYVLETLESAKAQTYQNIELIVSDDGSTDDTVEICRKWIKENKERFVRTELITVPVNTGIPANCNRGVRASHGEWVKLIAGDDLLMVDCISGFVNSLNQIEESNWKGILYSKIKYFKIASNTYIDVNITEPKITYNDQISASTRYKLALRNIGPSFLTMFFNKSILNEVGNFDEDFPLCEDWPLYLKLTKAKVPFKFVNFVNLKYRIHSTSTYNSNLGNKIYSKWFLTNWFPIYNKYVKENIPVYERLLMKYKYYIILLFVNTKLNDFKVINRLINYILCIPCKLHYKFILFILTK